MTEVFVTYICFQMVNMRILQIGIRKELNVNIFFFEISAALQCILIKVKTHSLDMDD